MTSAGGRDPARRGGHGLRGRNDRGGIRTLPMRGPREALALRRRQGGGCRQANRWGRGGLMAGNAKSRVEPGQAGRLAQVPPDRIRNVVLVGHAASGKTCLVESLLLGTGTLTRLGRVEDGTTVCDHEDVERRMGRSVSLAVASVLHEGVKVNFVDTPGH